MVFGNGVKNIQAAAYNGGIQTPSGLELRISGLKFGVEKSGVEMSYNHIVTN